VAAGFALDFDQLDWSDLVAVVGGVRAGVAGRYGSFNEPSGGFVAGCVCRRIAAEQSAATLVGVSLFAVGADGIVNGVG
jgi:hypothetical protein